VKIEGSSDRISVDRYTSQIKYLMKYFLDRIAPFLQRVVVKRPAVYSKYFV